MRTHFPFTFTPEPNVPDWQRFRAEGLPPERSWRHALAYARKSYSKKLTAPVEEYGYFDHQRELFRHLMEQPTASAVARMAMVGDIMWLRDGWFDFLDSGVLSHLNAHEAVLGNLESVISPNFKVKSLLPDYAKYNSHPNLVQAFRRADGTSTFSALSVGNNHSLDCEDLGMIDTIDLLDDEDILHSGVRPWDAEKSYVIFTVNGVKIGFHAAMWGLNDPAKEASSSLRFNMLRGTAPHVTEAVDITNIQAALDGMAAEGAQFRVVALHWGYEHEYYPSADLMPLGRRIISAGADVIMGTHPHVQQPCEIAFINGYENRYSKKLPAMTPEQGCVIEAAGPPRKGLIAWSLGNFASTMFTFACKVGWILSLRLHENDSTRQMDWEPDASTFVINQPRMKPDGKRKLLLWVDYQRLRKQHGAVPKKELAYMDFLHRHLAG